MVVRCSEYVSDSEVEDNLFGDEERPVVTAAERRAQPVEESAARQSPPKAAGVTRLQTPTTNYNTSLMDFSSIADGDTPRLEVREMCECGTRSPLFGSCVEQLLGIRPFLECE